MSGEGNCDLLADITRVLGPKLLHPPELMVWISCGLDEHENPQAFELLPRMGASPQTPWLRGAGAPLRIPPGGACEQPCTIS